MVEGGGNEISEEDLLEAIYFGHRSLQAIIGLQEELKQKRLQLENDKRKAAAEPALAALEKKPVPPPFYDSALRQKVLLAEESLRERIRSCQFGKNTPGLFHCPEEGPQRTSWKRCARKP